MKTTLILHTPTPKMKWKHNTILLSASDLWFIGAL
jgi:hypothetical protein